MKPHELVTAIAACIAALASGVALYLQYRARHQPLRDELHRRQLDAVHAVLSTLTRANVALIEWGGGDPRAKGAPARYLEAIDSLDLQYGHHAFLLPAAITNAISGYRGQFIFVEGRFRVHGDATPRFPDPDAFLRDVSETFGEVVLRARSVFRIDALEQQMSEGLNVASLRYRSLVDEIQWPTGDPIAPKRRRS